MGSVDGTTTKITGITVAGTNPELGTVLTIKFYKDDGDGIQEVGTDDILIPGAAGHLSDNWTNTDLGFGLASGANQIVWAELTFDSTADNTFQSKTAAFDLGFILSQ